MPVMKQEKKFRDIADDVLTTSGAQQQKKTKKQRRLDRKIYRKKGG